MHFEGVVPLAKPHAIRPVSASVPFGYSYLAIEGQPMTSFAGFQPINSPLYMAVHNPVLHQFISYLAEKKAEQEADPAKKVEIHLTRSFIAEVRESFRQNILDGEQHLHLLAHLLSSRLLREFELHSNVIGVLPGEDDSPFLIRERLKRDTLFSVTDIDLGNRMLENFRYRRSADWVALQLSANFIEYIPHTRPDSSVNRLTSRVKAEEELWNKVADELFLLDQLVARDKHLRQYSKFIKDIFGIKIVCDDDQDCKNVYQILQNMQSEDGESDRLLEFVETKDYLTCEETKMKKTGWKALKSVVLWQERLFEIQIQPLVNYYLEIDHMSGPSHRSFKISRDSLRDEISKQLPLYGLYRDLLRMIFMEEVASFNSDNASVIIDS
jgi:ppGpp synthetase/RelA/SpoT-type nucleotidyltranferase